MMVVLDSRFPPVCWVLTLSFIVRTYLFLEQDDCRHTKVNDKSYE